MLKFLKLPLKALTLGWLVSASGEVSISIGGSFSETPEENGRTKTFEETVARVYEISAPPFVVS
jgi:hypothetical protein